MAYVLKSFPEPEDPRKPKGAVGRALWRTVKQSVSESNINVNMRLVVIGALGWMFYAWGNPHILYNYTYFGSGAALTYTSCEYLGLQPFRTRGPGCPLVVWREWPEFR